MDTSAVKRYSCLYTSDIKKKAKRFHDGFIRVHHYNSKMFLLEFELKPLATTFYSTKRGASSTRLSDSFVLQEGEEIEFEEGFKVEIIELVLESTTNLSELRSATESAKAQSNQFAKSWATALDQQSPLPGPRSRNHPYTPKASTSKLALDSPSSGSAKENGIVKVSERRIEDQGVYRGLGIAPPKSYTTAAEAKDGGKGKGKSTRGVERASWTEYSTPKPTPYSRSSASNVTVHSNKSPMVSLNSTSRLKTDSNVQAHSISTPLTSSSMRGISSPFKPPTFTAGKRSTSTPTALRPNPVIHHPQSTKKSTPAIISRSLNPVIHSYSARNSTPSIISRGKSSIVEQNDFVKGSNVESNRKKEVIDKNDFWGTGANKSKQVFEPLVL